MPMGDGTDTLDAASNLCSAGRSLLHAPKTHPSPFTECIERDVPYPWLILTRACCCVLFAAAARQQQALPDQGKL
jgi:hypothetical protein